jgi:peptidoglycan/xylan/chitin deacetylase (PgdA/CDA1 family)
VALTFDACATPQSPAGYDAKLIATLEAAQAPATLFLGGLWMQHHPDATRALAANPRFELANHSWSHPDFRTLTPAQMADEIARTQVEQEQLAGRRGRLFRLPYGFSSSTALAVVAAQGLTCIEWDTVTGDPDPHLSAKTILRNALGARNGSIIIMHMNGRGWHTAEALPKIVQRLRQRGMTLVTVSQLLGLESRS